MTRFKIAGRYRITGYRAGTDLVIVQSPWIDNRIVDLGLHEILDDLMGQRTSGILISKSKLGTGATAADASDTDLENPTVTSDFIANRSRVDETITLEFFYADAEVPEDDYTEFGLFIGDTMFARSIISPTYTKAENQDTKIDYQISGSAA